MPSTPQLQSDVMSLVRSLPTVKDATQAKQGLRAIRDELLYRKSDHPFQLNDNAKLEELHISDLLQAWFNSPAGENILEDMEKAGADAVLAEFDEALKHIELVQLNLAYVAPTDDLVRYHKWFSQVLNKPVMLDVKVDKSLLAGASFVYKDHLHDFSIATTMPKIEETLLMKFKGQGSNGKVAG